MMIAFSEQITVSSSICLPLTKAPMSSSTGEHENNTLDTLDQQRYWSIFSVHFHSVKWSNAFLLSICNDIYCPLHEVDLQFYMSI